LGYYIQHPDEAIVDHGHAEVIANKAYGPHAHKGIELGNTQEGDGWKYRGRGLKQITGRDNYRSFTSGYRAIWGGNEDFEANPDLLTRMPYSLRAAIWFWMTKTNHDHQHCWQLADHGVTEADVNAVTRIVNHGELGHPGAHERVTNVQYAYSVFNHG